MLDQFAGEPAQVAAGLHQIVKLLHGCPSIPFGHGRHQAIHGRPASQPQKRPDVLLPDRSPRKGGDLLELHQRVPQGPLRRARQDLRSPLVEVKALLAGHQRQAVANFRRGQAMEVMALTPGQDGRKEVLRVSCGQDEDDVGRRLLQGLEQGVERGGRQLVDLVNDVDLEASLGRRKVDFVHDELADLVHLRVRGGIDLQHIHARAVGDPSAQTALVAGFGRRALGTVQCLGEDPSRAGLAGPTGTTEQVGPCRRS